jgi:hypothetical protein
MVARRLRALYVPTVNAMRVDSGHADLPQRPDPGPEPGRSPGVSHRGADHARTARNSEPEPRRKTGRADTTTAQVGSRAGHAPNAGRMLEGRASSIYHDGYQAPRVPQH